MDSRFVSSVEGKRLLGVVSWKTVTFYSEGDVIVGDIFFPPDFSDARRWPAILIATGFSGIREAGLNERGLRFANAGYVTLSIDYRGWGDSGGERGRLAPLEQVEDIRNGLTYLTAQPFVDPERLGAWGVSFGGLTVPYAAAVDTRIKAAIGQVGVADGYQAVTNVRTPEQMREWELEVATAREQRVLRNERSRPLTLLDVFVDEQALEWLPPAYESTQEMRTPLGWDSIGRVMDFRPIDIIHRVAPRALGLIVAERDTTGDPESYRKLFDAAREPKRWLPFDCGHFDMNQGPLLEDASRTAVEFFDEFLP